MPVRTAFPSRAALAALALALACAPAGEPSGAPSDPTPLQREYQAVADRVIDRALSDSAAWQRLAELTDRFGPRFSGTPALEEAIDWILDQMRRDGFEEVRGEPVMVPRWVRGEESAELLSPRPVRLPMLGLGGSIGTPPAGITADVLVVGSFDELQARAPEARGRIVLYDVPFTTYGETVPYRVTGAIEAARAGAVASMVRSVGPYGMQTPHTGGMRYDSTVTPIPHFAITMEDAMMLRRMAARGDTPRVRVRMGARTLPDVESRNLVGELRGREFPEQVVVIGGHIDSWDVGTGAMDDAGGVVVAWEAVRLLRELGLQPRRTIRVVGWTNEENGLRGGNAYRDRHRATLVDHVAAIESDGGVFRPIGFGFTGSDSARVLLRQVVGLLRRIGADSLAPSGGGADIGPIMAEGVPGISHNVDGTRYFWYHHSHADTVDKLDPREVAMNVAAMAVVAYVIADMPERLPR